MFSQMFGGAAFNEWVGEIALGKQFQQAMEISMTDEEKEELKKELNSTDPAANVNNIQSDTPVPSAPGTAASIPTSTSASSIPADIKTASGTSTPPTAGTDVHIPTEHDKKKLSTPSKEKDSGKLTPEQKQQMREMEAARAVEQEKRVKTLAKQLVDRCRPFETATRPGDIDGSLSLLIKSWI